MKYIALVLTCLGFWRFDTQAQSLSKTMTYGGQTRSYRIFIPDNYDSMQPAPLVLALHGLGDDASNFQTVGFAQIADTANFIVVYPNALPDALLQGTAWNTGIYPGNVTDDVGFLGALLDTVISEYAIDTNRVYTCGFSLGGFMTYRLACEMGERFAAVASVAGSLPAPSIANCYSGKAMPVLHIHGTSDQVIPYLFGTIYFVVTNLGADSTTHYWAHHNSCNLAAAHDSIPDSKNDGLTFEKYSYSAAPDSGEVILIKVNGMDHNWPSSSNDINATKEIWKFFSRHSKAAAPADTTGTGIADAQTLLIRFNRVDPDHLVMTNLSGKTKIIVTDSAGKEVYNAETSETEFDLSLNRLESGLYFVMLLSKNSRVTEKLFVGR